MTALASQPYRLRITTLTPLHIGCGDVYEPYQYFFKEKKITSFIDVQTGDRRNREEKPKLIHILQPEKLFSKDRSQINEVVNRIFQSKIAIAETFEIQKILKEKYFQFQNEVEKQEISADDSVIEHYQELLKKIADKDLSEFNSFQIQRTSHLQFSQLPYIPGSSLKGAMRTVILNFFREQMRNPGFSLPETGTIKEKEIYDNRILRSSKFEDDPFKNLIISDLSPLPPSQNRKQTTPRAIGYAINRKKPRLLSPGIENQGIPQLIEVLNPYSYFQGSMTIKPVIKDDEAPSSMKSLPDLETILTSFQKFFKSRIEEEKEDYFPNQAEHPAWKEYQAYLSNYAKAGKATPKHSLLRLGRFCGAESMTDEAHRQISIPQRKPPVHNAKSGDTRFFFHEKRRDSGAGLPFGWVLAEFLPT